jgi:hypothetical protein
LFLTAQARAAPPASPSAEHGHRLADLHARDTGAEGVDPAGILVAEDPRRRRQPGSWRRCGLEVEVRMADPGGADADPYLAEARLGFRNLLNLER